jgi:hypothetical protein
VPARRLFLRASPFGFVILLVVSTSLTHPTNIAHGDSESRGMMMAGTDFVKTNPRHKS